ncbi:MFS transporter [Streptosporangium sp. NPDC051023]|uniref:MFS transporter n=1 Tax=Streptosporangium sp. NPDC051023 TaxID=3155410 RepID=UPI00344B6124
MSDISPAPSLTAPPASLPQALPQRRAPLWRTLAVFTLTAVLSSGQLYVVIPLLHGMAAGWQTPQSGLTWLVTAFGVGYAAGFLLFGPLSDRYGRKRLICLGLPIAAVATALVAVAPGPEIAIAFRVLQGVTVAIFPPAAMAYMAERIEPRHRMVALATVTSGFLAAAVLFQVVAQALGPIVGWRGIFLISAVAFAVAAVAAAAVMLPDPSRELSGSFLSAYRAVPALLATPALLLRYAATVTILATFVAVYTGLQLGGPVGVAGSPDALMALRISGLPSMIVVPLLTPLLGRIAASRRAAYLLALAALALAAVAVIRPGLVGLALLLAVYVLGVAAGAPALNENIGVIAGQARGTALALFTFSLFLGGSLGPQLATAFITGGFGALMYGLAGILLLGVLALLAATHTGRVTGS